MNDLRRRKYLKSRFEDGDCPNGEDFSAMIDSCINQKSDQIFAVEQQLGIGTEEPGAPLEIKGARGKLSVSLIASDGCHSTLRIAHPGYNTVAIGGNKKDDVQIGTFGDSCDGFSPTMTVTSSGQVGIGLSVPEAELHVLKTIKAGESVAIGDAVLTFHKKKLWLTAYGEKYRILMEDEHHHGGKSKLMIVLLVLCCVNLAAFIVFLILYLLHIL